MPFLLHVVSYFKILKKKKKKKKKRSEDVLIINKGIYNKRLKTEKTI